jgi:hypothetical protein
VKDGVELSRLEFTRIGRIENDIKDTKVMRSAKISDFGDVLILLVR